MEIRISDQQANQRFDRFLRKFFKRYPEIRLSDIFHRIRKGAIKVNGRKTEESKKLIVGDVVSLEINDAFLKNPIQLTDKKSVKREALPLEKIKKQILFEDNNRLFFDKPAGIVVHEGNYHETDLTFNDYLEEYCIKIGSHDKENPTFKPSFGYRLDKDTSGIIVGTKTYAALQYINKIIRERQTEKFYIAVVIGKFPTKLDMREPLFKGFSAKTGKGMSFVNTEKGLEARTTGYNILTVNHPELGEISLVKLQLFTGRMHQIRVHCAHHKFPIVGDITYGSEVLNRIAYKKTNIPRQLLHAYGYGFYDKFSQKNLFIKTNFPEDFKKLFPKINSIAL